jgi:hypothetical protein
MKIPRVEPWIHALVAGATAGVLAEVLVMRLNPEVAQSTAAALTALPLWTTWGILGGGIPLVVAVALVKWIRPASDDWPAPELTALVFVVAGVMSWINADLHSDFLSETAQRILTQDVVFWILCALLALTAGGAIRRFGAWPSRRVAFALVMIALPTMRLVWQPIPYRRPVEVAARSLGEPARPLLVVGVDSLDSQVLLVHAGGDRYQHLDDLRSSGTWGPLNPSRPYLRQSLWTTLATGTNPGRHGVKFHRGWQLPWHRDEPLRLLPWTPQGSRLILPWGVADLVTPPPSSMPPLWERLRASGVSTAAIGWPGIWGPDVNLNTVSEAQVSAPLDDAIRDSLERALEPFGEQRRVVWQAVLRDQRIVDSAVRELSSGTRDVWLHLEGLAATRRHLEPVKPMHIREREVLGLVIELLDVQLGRLVAVSQSDTLIAVVSPYGLAPPSSLERLRRLLGIGDDWRTSAEDCPDGVLLLSGVGVPQGQRFAGSRLTDFAPTLCYLLGLPVAQYMEGGVILEGVEEEYLASHPLRVVD